MTAPALVLCSASPRRRQLLASLGLEFTQLAPDIDEARKPGESPSRLAERLAREKALAGLELFRRQAAASGQDVPATALALAADTVVAIGDEDLAKPADREDVARMLRALSGRVHKVISGVCVAGGSVALGPDVPLRSTFVSTEVRFAMLSEAQIRWLADSGDGDGKAGGYALQGLAGAFVERIDGSVTGVIGLPLHETLQLLAEAGVRLPWDKR